MLNYNQATDTVLISIMHQVAKTSSNLIPPGDDISQYTQAEINTRIYGSKLVLVVEQMQILTIWLIKACLLIMYNRMTLVLPQHKTVVATSVYVAVSFVVMEVLYLGVWCRPFNQYWAVPPSSSKHIAGTQLYGAYYCRTMLRRNEPSHHECRVQHFQRFNHHLHTHAASVQSALANEEQDHLGPNLLHWNFYHCRCCPQQVLFLHTSFWK